MLISYVPQALKKLVWDPVLILPDKEESKLKEVTCFVLLEQPGELIDTSIVAVKFCILPSTVKELSFEATECLDSFSVSGQLYYHLINQHCWHGYVRTPALSFG